jgi:phytoene synthase
MHDAFAYCADLVRSADRDRFLASLFAPAEQRNGLHALYAFDSEVSRVREVARQPLPGEIRLQWWNDALRGERAGEAAANPVAAALLATVQRYKLAIEPLVALVEAHTFDLYDEPMATVADLEAYGRKTASVVIAAAAQILGAGETDAIADRAGLACSITGIVRRFALHAARGQVYVPVELLERHGVRLHDVFAKKSSPGLGAAMAELISLARVHLRAARDNLAKLPEAALPALLPLALVRPALDRLERSDAFAPARDTAPWRRQWLLWRAARNPARIAG